jgi:hypothetical protein
MGGTRTFLGHGGGDFERIEHTFGCQPFLPSLLTAINPVIALELLATGAWSGAGVLGTEVFAPGPFLELLTAYGSPWGIEERSPSGIAR